MKKWFVFAFIALFVTACGNKTKESVELVDSLIMAGDSVLAESVDAGFITAERVRQLKQFVKLKYEYVCDRAGIDYKTVNSKWF